MLSDSRSTRDMSIIFSKGSDAGQSEPLSVTDNLHNQTEEESLFPFRRRTVQSLLRNGAAFDQVDEAENEANKFSDYGALPREEAIHFNQHANFRIKSTLISNSLPKIHRCSFIKGPMSE